MIINGQTFSVSPLRPPIVTLSDIEDAQERIAGKVHETPCRRSRKLSTKLDCPIFLKLENLHETGSFKERGAANAMACLTKSEASAGIVAASAGNHAQAVALHATKLGIKSHIVMPKSTPLIKTSRTAYFGGDVILKGAMFDDALAWALNLRETEGYTFLPPFDDINVIAGQGTCGLEILNDVPDVGTVLVPVGGGGLVGGIAAALKNKNPEIRVIGVEPIGAASMVAAVKAGYPYAISSLKTFADGVAVRRVGDKNLNIVQHYVDELITVSESEIAHAILFLLEEEKLVAEGAGALGIAALIKGIDDLDKSKPVCAVLSGGNIDTSTIARIIDRGLVEMGRLYRVTLEIADTPGALVKILQLVSAQEANLVEVLHERNFNISEGFGKTNVQLQLETRGPEHIEEINAALQSAECRIIDHL